MSRFVNRNKKGFTLIEIMIVVLIISVLLAIAIPNFMRARESSRAKACQGNLKQMETAKEQYAMDNNASDGDAATEGDLVPNYIKQSPTCPGGGAYTWNAIGTNNVCDIGANTDAGTWDDHIIP